jgi:uncharacterized protein
MPSPLVFFNIVTTDLEASKAFFRDLFDWEIGSDGISIDPGGPADFDPKGTFVEARDGQGPAATLWFRVGDLWATIEKAESLGAKVLIPIRQNPGGAHFALIRTPEGLPIGIVQS